MNNFVYDIPVRVYFGENQFCYLGEELKKYGSRVLMVYGGGSIKKIGLYDKVVSEIKKAGLTLFELPGVEPNPRIESVRKGAQICKDQKIDVLLAVGGGSTIDATKWIAAGACVEHDAWDFFSKWSPVEKALPVLDILTLSATGSEMDAGGVISNPETQDKIGRMADPLLPKVSFLDPSNTYSVSPYQTACGAADMMSHIMEVYFNMEPDLYMLDCFMEGMMKTIIKYAPVAMREPDNYTCNGYHRYGKENCTAHRIDESTLDKLIYNELLSIKEEAEANYKTIESDVKNWLTKKNTTEKRIRGLTEKLAQRRSDQEQILLERIRDREHAEVYTAMLEKCETEIKNLTAEIAAIRDYDATIRKRKAEMKSSIDILGEIIKDGAISDTNLRLLVDSIVISEQDGKLSINIDLKAAFSSHLDLYDEDGILAGKAYAAN